MPWNFLNQTMLASSAFHDVYIILYVKPMSLVYETKERSSTESVWYP